MQVQKPVRTGKRGTFQWKRLLIFIALFIFLTISVAVLLLSTGHIINYFWFYSIPAILAVVGILVTALQWLFPLSPIEASQPSQELNEQVIDQKQELLKVVESLVPGVNVSVYQDKFGKPIFTQHLKESDIREYIFVNPYCYIKSVIDEDNSVIYYAITIKDQTFNPVFKSPDYPINETSFKITLGVSTFSDVSGLPEYLVGSLGARNFSYYETRYLGNPGHYQGFGFGLNQAGYLPNNSGSYLQVLANIPPYDRWSNTEQSLEILRDLRAKVVFNTYAVSAPSRSIQDFAVYELGVNFDQVRILNESSCFKDTHQKNSII
jgi:hypothetical protein